ncbi:hypothetical protein D3C85_1358430 [compost metagenome]
MRAALGDRRNDLGHAPAQYAIQSSVQGQGIGIGKLADRNIQVEVDPSGVQYNRQELDPHTKLLVLDGDAVILGDRNRELATGDELGLLPSQSSQGRLSQDLGGTIILGRLQHHVEQEVLREELAEQRLAIANHRSRIKGGTVRRHT